MPSLAGHARNAFQASRSAINNPGIAQDNVIFAVLLFGFVVWITTKGELPTYLAFFKPGNAGIPAVTVNPSSTTAASGSAPAVVNSGIPGVPGISSNPLQGLPIPTWLGGSGTDTIGGLPAKVGGLVGIVKGWFGQ